MLFDYKNKDGKRLQGILALPDDYKAGEKRPMLVTFYEKNSQNMHRYSAPSYLTGMGASPMEAVTPRLRHDAARHPLPHRLVAQRHARVRRGRRPQGDRDGLRRSEADRHHAATATAAKARPSSARSRSCSPPSAWAPASPICSPTSARTGAGPTRCTGGSGANGNDYYLYGQGRWGFSPWDNPERYRFESALTHAPKVAVPFLIMHGTADPTVAFQNGLGFYNALRYNGKTAYLLAYPNEGHGLRGMAQSQGSDHRAISSSSITT